MIKLAFYTAIFGILLSCSTGNELMEQTCSGEIEQTTQQFPQQWKLIKMTGNMINSETTGANMAWQELILLKPDNTFTKSRIQGEKLTEASGTYSFVFVGDEESLQLTLLYDSYGPLIGSCFSGSLMETYVLTSRCSLQGTWAMCDGPGLEYKRQQISRSNTSSVD